MGKPKVYSSVRARFDQMLRLVNIPWLFLQSLHRKKPTRSVVSRLLRAKWETKKSDFLPSVQPLSASPHFVSLDLACLLLLRVPFESDSLSPRSLI